jgi:aryl sulfotransferase
MGESYDRSYCLAGPSHEMRRRSHHLWWRSASWRCSNPTCRLCEIERAFPVNVHKLLTPSRLHTCRDPLRYIYIGRDGRDVAWSMYNYHASANETWYAKLNDSPGLVGPPIGRPVDNVLQYYREWISGNGYPWWPFWENVRSWWAIRGLPNVHMLHFHNLKKDLPGEIRKLAMFLEIPIDERKWDAVVEHCTFEYMKMNATASVPLGGAFWDGGAQAFIHKGTNGRWKEQLTEEDVKKYHEVATAELGPECAKWLETGEQ